MRKLFDLFKTKKYEFIGANSLMEGIKLNGFSINKKNDSNVKTTYFTLNETLDKYCEVFKNKGGIITFSKNVNSVNSNNYKLFELIKNHIHTFKNNEDVYGISIGHFIIGKYKAKNGQIFDEKSYSIEIVGITTETLNKLAFELADKFKQESVLVKNYKDNKAYLI